jgi:CHAD domain-containing protein
MVHDLRVSCRRAETALDAGRSHLKNKAAAWFRDHLQKVRDSCNALRDDEVLRKWLRQQTASEAQQQLIKCISKDMKAGRRVVAARARKLILQNHFRRHIHDLESRARAAERIEVGGSLADHSQLELGRWLFHVLDDLIQAMPDDPTDFDALHQLRVAGKHLRYGLELVQELDPTASLAGSIGLLNDMQDKLGELHDAVVRLPRLKTEFADATSEAAEIVTAAQEALERCIVGWREWWEFKVLDQVVSECSREATRLVMAERN